MSEYIVELDGKHSIALKLAFAEEMRGGDFVHEEVVRCRDCTHYMTWANGYSFCSAFSIGATGDPFPGEPDGFCAWGARRDV